MLLLLVTTPSLHKEGPANCLPAQRLLHFHKGGENQPFLVNQPGAKRAKLFWEMADKHTRKPYQRFVLTCKGIFFDERIQTVVWNVLSAKICFQRSLSRHPDKWSPSALGFLIKIFTFSIKDSKCKKCNQQKIQFKEQRMKNSGSIFVLSACYWASLIQAFEEGWSAGTLSFTLEWPGVWSALTHQLAANW